MPIPVCQLVYCTTVLFKVLYCKIKTVLFFAFFKCIPFSSVQSLSRVRLFATPGTAACQASLSITTSRSLLKLMSIVSTMPSTISSSLVPFSSHLQSFPKSGSFPASQFYTSGGQSIGVSASASVLPMNIQGWFPLGWAGWISLLSKPFNSTVITVITANHSVSQ